MEHYLGVDLTAAAQRPTAVAVLDAGLRVRHLGQVGADAELLELARSWPSCWVGMDAPLGLPRGLHCLERSCPCQPDPGHELRLCERELRRLGIACFYTVKGSIIRAMVYRAIKLRRDLEAEKVPLLEVYPYASKVRLWGRMTVQGWGKKSTAKGRANLEAALRTLPIEAGESRGWSHDTCDALLAAYGLACYLRGLGELLGEAEEGQIVLPLAAACVAEGARL